MLNLKWKINKFLGLNFFGRHVKCCGHINLGKNCFLGSYSELIADKKNEIISIGNNTKINSYSLLHCHSGSISIGNNCTINQFSVLYGHGGLKIGNDVQIATHCVLIPANHVFSDLNTPIRQQGLSCKGITIEDNVWIGARSVILDGTTIGTGSIIGAGSIVTKEIPPNSIAVGNPAMVIRSR